MTEAGRADRALGDKGRRHPRPGGWQLEPGMTGRTMIYVWLACAAFIFFVFGFVGTSDYTVYDARQLDDTDISGENWRGNHVMIKGVIDPDRTDRLYSDDREFYLEGSYRTLFQYSGDDDIPRDTVILITGDYYGGTVEVESIEVYSPWTGPFPNDGIALVTLLCLLFSFSLASSVNIRYYTDQMRASGIHESYIASRPGDAYRSRSRIRYIRLLQMLVMSLGVLLVYIGLLVNEKLFFMDDPVFYINMGIVAMIPLGALVMVVCIHRRILYLLEGLKVFEKKDDRH